MHLFKVTELAKWPKRENCFSPEQADGQVGAGEFGGCSRSLEGDPSLSQRVETLWYRAVEQGAALGARYRKQERQQPEQSELNYFQLQVTELAAGTRERISLLTEWVVVYFSWLVVCVGSGG